MYSYRVPESLYDKIDRMVKLRINEYERQLLVNVDSEKKSNPSDNVIIKDVTSQFETVIHENGWLSSKTFDHKDLQVKVNPSVQIKKASFIPNAKKNEVNMDALREIANGKGVKSELFATKKKPIDEQYDCIAVTRGIPDISERIYASAKSQIAFWDRDDNSVFYVNWEGKYYRFVNSSEFNKFLKDNQIK